MTKLNTCLTIGFGFITIPVFLFLYKIVSTPIEERQTVIDQGLLLLFLGTLFVAVIMAAEANYQSTTYVLQKNEEPDSVVEQAA